jgi:hypothetical protein
MASRERASQHGTDAEDTSSPPLESRGNHRFSFLAADARNTRVRKVTMSRPRILPRVWQSHLQYRRNERPGELHLIEQLYGAVVFGQC